MIHRSDVAPLLLCVGLLAVTVLSLIGCTPEGATTSSLPARTTQPAATASSPAAGSVAVVDVDVVIYGTQTSGLAAARELALHAPYLKVALISSGDLLETPLCQGLSVEDARDMRVLGGFYGEWRQMVIDTYAKRGVKPFNTSGRFVYEPEVAEGALWSLIQGEKAPNVRFYAAHLVAAQDQPGARFVDITVEGEGSLRLTTSYFLDASVEGDLARLLGASYRVGRQERIYNDFTGPTPAYPSAENNYETAPQRFSSLLTLTVYSNTSAPPVSAFTDPGYDPASYPSSPALSQKSLSAFPSSWTMKIAVLPTGKRELNERWNDWPDVGLSFQWVFSAEKRADIQQRVLERSINLVRYLQEHGYPEIGIAFVPETLYVREGPRIVGLDTYRADDLRLGKLRHPVALGCYVEYDRHDAFYPNHIATTRYACVPMEALLAQGHSRLLVSTAVSTDYAAYSSAVRTEPTRASMGGAAAAIIIISDRLGVEPDQVPYEDLRRELVAAGYVLDVPK